MPLILGSGRALTVLAVGFLLLDGVLLCLAGVWARRPVPVLLAGLLIVTAGLVTLLWRRHLRQLQQIAAVRQEIKDEVRALRELAQRQ